MRQAAFCVLRAALHALAARLGGPPLPQRMEVDGEPEPDPQPLGPVPEGVREGAGRLRDLFWVPVESLVTAAYPIRQGLAAAAGGSGPPSSLQDPAFQDEGLTGADLTGAGVHALAAIAALRVSPCTISGATRRAMGRRLTVATGVAITRWRARSGTGARWRRRRCGRTAPGCSGPAPTPSTARSPSSTSPWRCCTSAPCPRGSPGPGSAGPASPPCSGSGSSRSSTLASPRFRCVGSFRLPRVPSRGLGGRSVAVGREGEARPSSRHEGRTDVHAHHPHDTDQQAQLTAAVRGLPEAAPFLAAAGCPADPAALRQALRADKETGAQRAGWVAGCVGAALRDPALAPSLGAWPGELRRFFDGRVKELGAAGSAGRCAAWRGAFCRALAAVAASEGAAGTAFAASLAQLLVAEAAKAARGEPGFLKAAPAGFGELLPASGPALRERLGAAREHVAASPLGPHALPAAVRALAGPSGGTARPPLHALVTALVEATPGRAGLASAREVAQLEAFATALLPAGPTADPQVSRGGMLVGGVHGSD